MSGADVRDAYEAWHDRLDVDAESDTPWHRMVKRRLQVERDVADKRVLEIACGRGGFACWLAGGPRPPRTLVAADFAVSALRKAKSFALGQRVEIPAWEAGDIRELAHPGDTFDTVFSCETVEHVPDPARAVREMARVLRPGGRLFLTTPNYLGVMGLYRLYLRIVGRRYTEEGQPVNHLTLIPRTVAWVIGAGLRVELVDGTGHYLPFPRRPPIEVPLLERPSVVTRWFALHSLVVARKPDGTTSESGE